MFGDMTISYSMATNVDRLIYEAEKPLKQNTKLLHFHFTVQDNHVVFVDTFENVIACFLNNDWHFNQLTEKQGKWVLYFGKYWNRTIIDHPDFIYNVTMIERAVKGSPPIKYFSNFDDFIYYIMFIENAYESVASCKNCGKYFALTTRKDQKFCSKECIDKNTKKQWAQHATNNTPYFDYRQQYFKIRNYCTRHPDNIAMKDLFTQYKADGKLLLNGLKNKEAAESTFYKWLENSIDKFKNIC